MGSLTKIVVRLVAFPGVEKGTFSIIKIELGVIFTGEHPEIRLTKTNIEKINNFFICAPQDPTQIAFTKRLYEVNYFTLNRWGEPPGQMLQPLLVQTLQNTHHFRTVAQAPFIGQYDYVLNTQILKLIQDFRFCPAILKLKVSAQIIKVTNGRVVATDVFEVEERLPVNPPYGGIVAANRAVAKVLEAIAYLAVHSTP